ncbi:MAG TPA: L-aspartate oxidase [Candidatus Latescibacteria bacterium]|jgi:L-aspartate oxidase|nr:L-aspartate oxidase [Candidatus Latescibacterota bacterium]
MASAVESDYLVIGTGIAGLSFALKAAEVGSVTVITKKESQESNTNYAQGGIASVLSPDDSFDLHTRDTLEAGAGLCKRDVVDLVVKAGPRMVQELIDWGVKFTREKSVTRQKRVGADKAPLALGREGGHSKNRIAFSADLTGREIERALTEAVSANPNIRQYEHHAAIDLITEHHLLGAETGCGGTINCYGCYGLDENTGKVVPFVARATILCSGGAGQIYEHTTNPKIATGDGIAMAYRAGASVGNLEFVQFHPTTLYRPGADSFLISEAVRGHGGVLVNRAGQPFMEGAHPLASLAPRDIVARAIDSEMKKSGESCVFLDITHKPAEEIRERFPNIHEKCLSFGIDITKDRIPVVPAAHYACGGVFTDTSGRTDIRGLFAAGEVTCTGLHGSNRLASNSLLEALVFSDRALKAVTDEMDRSRGLPDVPDWQEDNVFNTEEWVLLEHDREEIRSLMWDYVGIVRTDFRLKRAARRIGVIAQEVEAFYKRTKVTEALVELRNVVTVAALTVRCALKRKESRGLHFNADYPDRIDGKEPSDTILSARETWVIPPP